jgi:hypothetical protein
MILSLPNEYLGFTNQIVIFKGVESRLSQQMLQFHSFLLGITLCFSCLEVTREMGTDCTISY